MKTFEEAEALIESIERDLDALKSRQLRQFARETVEEYRKIVQHLRRCENVQHFLEDYDTGEEDAYDAVDCPACANMHLVNRATGEVLGRG
ncbi:hypothetical protein [Bradyrhizobium sp. USDA 4452]